MTRALTDSGAEPPPVARRQAGVFTREQALAAGLSRWQIERRVAAGVWVPLTHVALVASDRTAMTSAWAVHLTWPDAVVSHWTAAALHGLPVPEGMPPLHATLSRRLRSTAALVAHRLDLDEHEVQRLGGVPVTTPQRTAVDCLRVAEPDDARQLITWVLTRRVLSREQLVAEAVASPGRRGTPQLVRVVAETRGDVLSRAERLLQAVLRRGGVGGWAANVTVQLAGRSVVVDLLFARERVVVEVDGWAAHGTREAFETDRRRQNALVNAGYLVLRFTWRDLTEREADVVWEIRDALDRRGAS